MALIAQRSIDEVKAAADMVAVVQARTQLRRAGSRWTGRCPFHEERTPSFSVNAEDISRSSLSSVSVHSV